MGESVYLYGFTNWADVVREFSVTNTFEQKEPDEVLFAEYDLSQYEGSADVIYRRGDDWYWVSGGHCSCYGLEGQWEPVAYDDTLAFAEALERHYLREKWAPIVARLRNRLGAPNV